VNFPCGHPRTPENIKTYNGGTAFKGRCRACWNALEAKRRAENLDTLHLEYRVRVLPKQIASTRAKLARLEAEALAMGFADLVERRV
jgi:hypothetical protein